jgi:tetratricopeptide (TPR) repeat protein
MGKEKTSTMGKEKTSTMGKEKTKVNRKVNKSKIKVSVPKVPQQEEGNQLFREGKIVPAIKKYTEALKTAADSPLLYSNRSACYLQQKQWKQAFEDARKACELDPSLVKGWYRQAVALRRMSHLREARAAIRKAVKVSARKGVPADVEEEKQLIEKTIKDGCTIKPLGWVSTAQKAKAKKLRQMSRKRAREEAEAEDEGDAMDEDAPAAKKRKKEPGVQYMTMEQLKATLKPGEKLI